MASVLTNAWVRKMQFYYDLYLAESDPLYIFKQEDHEAYEESEEFKTAFPLLDGKTLKAAQELRRLQIGRPRGEA